MSNQMHEHVVAVTQRATAHLYQSRTLIENLGNLGGRFAVIQPGSKVPKCKGWNKAENGQDTEQALDYLDKGYNITLLAGTGGVYAFDFDSDANRGYESLPLDGAMYIHRPNAPHKAKLLFRCNEPIPTRLRSKKHGIDLLGVNSNGTYCSCVIAGVHNSRAAILWGGHMIPLLPVDTVAALWEGWTGEQLFPAKRQSANHDAAYGDTNLARVADALNYIAPWDVDYITWIGIIAAIHDEFGDDALDLVVAWADGKPGEVEAKWRSFDHEYTGQPITLATLFHFARKGGWRMGQTTAEIAALIRIAENTSKQSGEQDNDSGHNNDSGSEPTPASYTWPYGVKDGRIVHFRTKSIKGVETEIATPIAEFVAVIAGERVDDSGDKIFVIMGRGKRGGPFEVDVPASEYGDSSKLIARLESVSSRDPIHPEGRRHISAAIKKLTSDNIWRERHYTRTGWAEDKFLIPGREPKGVRIELPRKLAYGIDPGTDLAKGLEALKSLIQAPGAARGTVLLSHVLLAPMAEPAKLRNERAGIFIQGHTGVGKTTIAQLTMAIYGSGFLDDANLLRWGEGATRNAIMQLAASAHDMPLLIDNYKPETGDGARGFVNLIHAMLEGGEKERLNRNSQLRESKPVFCWPIFTGEDIPDNDPASLARLLAMQFDSNYTGENFYLNNAQKLGQHLPAVGGAWLDWLESEHGCSVATCAGNEAFLSQRDEWVARLHQTVPDMINMHRVATNLATNELAFVVALSHPTIGPILAPFTQAHKQGLLAIAQGMGNYTAQSLEATRYLHAVRELLTTRRAILRTDDKEVAKKYNAKLSADIVDGPLQDRIIGWSDGAGGAYLFPTAARRAVERLLDDNLGEISDNTLYDQLKSLAAVQPGKKATTMVKRLGGECVRVLHILRTALELQEDNTEGM